MHNFSILLILFLTCDSSIFKLKITLYKRGRWKHWMPFKRASCGNIAQSQIFQILLAIVLFLILHCNNFLLSHFRVPLLFSWQLRSSHIALYLKENALRTVSSLFNQSVGCIPLCLPLYQSLGESGLVLLIKGTCVVIFVKGDFVKCQIVL